jgi:hypothetical protein
VKKLMLMTLAAAALLVAAPAQAKELRGAQLCGPVGCVIEREAGMLEGQNGPFGGKLAVAVLALVAGLVRRLWPQPAPQPVARA